MRKLFVASLLAVALATSACKEPDPNKFETHIERIKDSEKRAAGFTGLETLTKTVVTAQDNDDLLDEFVAKVIPVFEEVWGDAEEHHNMMLDMLLAVGRPEGHVIWSQAVDLDGSSEARKKTIKALEGIKKAHAVDSADAVIAAFDKVIKDPKLDGGEQEAGRVRMLMAQTLGALGDKKAVPVLIKAMEQTQDNQPVAVHRAAAQALGRIGDPSAVDALLTVTFRVPDAPTTTNIGERSKVALVSIGEPAVPAVMKMLRGEHEQVNDLAAEHGVPLQVIQQTAAGILGAMGSTKSVDQLIAYMPNKDCAEAPPEGEPDEEAVMDAGLRAVIANALGFIGDAKAAEPLCSCINATHNPGDMFPIMEALGRIGGDKAFECLVGVVKDGEYKDDAVEKEFRYEPRWEAGRFALLASSPENVGQLEAAIASNKDKAVSEKLAQWKPGVELVKKCGGDQGCYLETLKDTNAEWIAREKAAFEVARLASGDLKMAQEIAKAFKVRSPDARISMAWLPGRMLDGKKCPECAASFAAVLEAEKMSMDKEYQASVLVARASMAKLQSSEQADADQD